MRHKAHTHIAKYREEGLLGCVLALQHSHTNGVVAIHVANGQRDIELNRSSKQRQCVKRVCAVHDLQSVKVQFGGCRACQGGLERLRVSKIAASKARRRT